MRSRNIVILLVIILALGGYFAFTLIPKGKTPTPPTVRAWQIDENDLQRINIQLVREGKGQAFIKLTDGTWHFDDSQQTLVEHDRWGAGIPLLLAGPKIERVIVDNATTGQLNLYGLTNPRMEIALTLSGGRSLEITAGDAVPDGSAFYLEVPLSTDIISMDSSWYTVFENLVKNPPYPASTATP